MLPSADSRFLYVSNQIGHEIVVYAVDVGSDNLREIERIPAGGSGPDSLALDPSGKWLAVAAKDEGRISIFACDPVSGTLSKTANTLDLSGPTSITWLLH